ncbi:MAG: hypothetical protein MAG795_00552 [Candidatus Woesearchaeota archaeon]|nr:hypothetical protein [Candidatus Woesearchaeota archaeon]
MQIEKSLLVGILVFFLFSLGFFMRNFPLTEGDLDKDVSPLMTTSDANYFIWRAKNAHDTQMPVVEPPYVASGVENAVSFYPPLIYTFMGSITQLTEVSPYQMAWFLICLLSALIPLYAFIVVKRYFNQNLALVVLALGLFTSSKFLFQIYIGFWADVFAFAPIVAFFYFLKDIWKEKSYLILIICAGLSSAALVGHVWEFMYFMLFLIISGFFVLVGEIKKKAMKNIGFLIIILVIFSSGFLTKYNVIGYGAGESFKLGENRGGPPDYFEKISFGIFFWIATNIGIYSIFHSKSKISIYQIAILLIPLFIILVRYSTLIGIEANHTYRQLYHSLVFLIIPAALGINYILELVKTNANPTMHNLALSINYILELVKTKANLIMHNLALGVVICLLIILAFGSTFNTLKRVQQISKLKKPEWDSLMWIKDNTPKDAKVLVLFGYYGQGLDVHAERQTLFDVYPENIQQICNQTIPKKFKGSWKFQGLTPKGFKILDTGQYFMPEYTDPTKSVSLDEIDYILVRYKDYQAGTNMGAQLDACMGYFIAEMMQQNNSVVWNSDQIAIIEVKNGD